LCGVKTLLASLALLLGLASVARADDFVVGFNQAWLEGKWAQDLAGEFPEKDWRRVLVRTREAGGTAMRVWLCEDRTYEGVIWDGHRPAGVQPRFLENVRKLGALAAEERVQLYWTLSDGNWFWDKSGVEYDRVWNVLNDKYGYGSEFRKNVLGPILDAINQRPATVYAFDCMNEIEGSVKAWFWPDKWDGARRYVKATAAFVKARAPGIKVTSSAGHGEAAADILAGRFDDLGLDFYDLHVYTDQMTVPEGGPVVLHAKRRGLTAVLGEFGQKRSNVDDAFQAKHVTAMLGEAKRLGFTAAFAWQLEDADRKFEFYDGDRARPAIEAFRKFAKDHARPVPAPPVKSKGLGPALEGK
jgi:hypothetical protein